MFNLNIYLFTLAFCDFALTFMFSKIFKAEHNGVILGLDCVSSCSLVSV